MAWLRNVIMLAGARLVFGKFGDEEEKRIFRGEMGEGGGAVIN